MSDKVKWGILGNAAIGRKCVLPAIKNSRNGTIRALATRRPGEAGAVIKINGIQSVYDSYDALLEAREIDAVYIPLPNHLHRPWAIKALNAGKHVLCEKPLACSAAETREMFAAARDANKLLMEAFMHRFHPRIRRIHQMVAEEGVVGRPRLVHTAFCFAMDPALLKSGNNPRFDPTGGGALLDVGCYGVTIARWIMGAEPIQVQAMAEYHPNGVDIHFTGSLRFPGGGLATVTAGFTSALQQTFTISGSEAAIELPHDAFVPWEKNAVFTVRGKNAAHGEQYIIPGVDEYRLMVEHFADVVLGRVEPEFDPRDSIRNMMVLDALATAARSGRTVDLPENETMKG